MKNDLSIPLLDYVVSWENFSGIMDFENFNVSIKKNEDKITVVFKNHIPANIYYYKLDDKYAYCFDELLLAGFLEEKNVTLTINDNWQAYQDQVSKRDSSLKHSKYNEIERITLYEEANLYIDHFDFVEKNDFFSVNIHEAGDIIKAWMKKYSDLVDELHESLCVELSAGLDTRSLTYFWAGKSINHIYTKNDEREIPIVEQLHDKYFNDYELKIGHKDHYIFDEHKNKIGTAITLSGKGADVFAVKGRYLDPSFYSNNICYLKRKHLIHYICPYLDKDLLKIKPDYPKQLKILMQYLLAEKYMDVPYKTFKKEEFVFTQEMKHMAMDMLEKWGINPY